MVKKLEHLSVNLSRRLTALGISISYGWDWVGDSATQDKRHTYEYTYNDAGIRVAQKNTEDTWNTGTSQWDNDTITNTGNRRAKRAHPEGVIGA